MSKTLKILSRPQGNAEEYGRWSVNPYLGCQHNCSYCYLKKGPGAKTLGGNVATLKKGVINDDHAYHLAMAEIIEHREEIIRDGGLFMTFTSDPCAPETRQLFFHIASDAIHLDIPVTLLTKNADFFQYPTVKAMFEDTHHLMSLTASERVQIMLKGSAFYTWLGNMYKGVTNQQMAFGWTLTGHDELEPNASVNAERIAAMKKMSDAGYKTWASIEPVIDFRSALDMIADALDAGCQHFKIGLLTNNTKVVKKEFSFDEHHFEAYDRAQCMSFTGNVMELTQGRATVYWKQSFYEFLEQREQSGTRSGSAESRQKSSEAQFLDYRPLFGMTAYEFLHQWSHSVDKDWSMFK